MAPPAVIAVRDLRKVYVVPEREAGFRAALRSVVWRRTKDVVAVENVSFDVQAGEMVGFLGPNGAGKTTTLKMLSGLIYPTSGDARVLGHVPSKREEAFLTQITLVMGQRNQLVWDIPAADSFELHKVVYQIPNESYAAIVKELTELLELGPLLTKPARSLSLGERMKCEIALSLLHQPNVLFLDEPTIGLDITMQRRIREFLKEYNRRHRATVLLTSHYMADVEALCKRVIVIHHGRLLYDGGLEGLVRKFSTHKTILMRFAQGVPDAAMLKPFGEGIITQDGQVSVRVPRDETAKVTARLLAQFPVSDLTVEDPPIEEVIEHVFTPSTLPQ